MGSVMAKKEWRRGRADSGGRTGLPVRLGAGALSFAEPMEPPPTVVTGRGNEPEVIPDRFSLSSPTLRDRAWMGDPAKGVSVWPPQWGGACPPNPSGTDWVCAARGRVG